VGEHTILGLMLVIVAVINLYCFLLLRDIHKITNETLLKVDVGFDFKKPTH
jgi:hypothetical protein